MICPHCGARDHKVVYYKKVPFLACPKMEENQIHAYNLEELVKAVVKLYQETGAKQTAAEILRKSEELRKARRWQSDEHWWSLDEIEKIIKEVTGEEK